MILLPLIAFGLYVVFNAKRTVKETCVRENTEKSSDATTRMIFIVVGAIVLLAALSGNGEF
jgi:hypothetical protein